MSGVRFSESARKMTQNGGRVVAIGPFANDFGNQFELLLEKTILEKFLWRICIGYVEKMRFSFYIEVDLGSVCFRILHAK